MQQSDIVLSIVLLILVVVVPCVILTLTQRTKKRGCGRGCATCPNQKMCHKK